MTAAVITGASAGLGAEFTRQLVREFPEIEEFWLIARRVGKLEELAQQFPEKKFVCMGLNLLDPKSFRYLGEKLAEQKAHADKFLVRELLGQLFKFAHATGDKPEFLDLREFPHKLARELRAKPGGRTGYDGRGHPRP